MIPQAYSRTVGATRPRKGVCALVERGEERKGEHVRVEHALEERESAMITDVTKKKGAITNLLRGRLLAWSGEPLIGQALQVS